MTDLHSHILFDIDDGSKNIDESIELLKKLSEIGFKNVFLTPHYIEGSDYSIDNKEKLYKFNILKKEIKKRNIKINIFLGNEIFINNNILELLQKDKILTMNNSRLLLIELPFNNEIINLDDILYEIKHIGYIPIIAHPERYLYFQKNHNIIKSLKESGVLFQSNYVSIIGEYGFKAKRLFKYMLKNKYIDFLGTDIHSINKTKVIDKFSIIEKKIIRIAGKKYYNEIIKNGNILARTSK